MTLKPSSLHEASLEGGLDFLASFDLVIAPLVLDYVADWHPVLRRFSELLRPGGWLVFSVSHPSFDAHYFSTDAYFEIEQVSCTWRGFDMEIEMPSYRRPLTGIIDAAVAAGFTVERLLEPRPTEEFRRADPVRYARLLRHPSFLCVRARRD